LAAFVFDRATFVVFVALLKLSLVAAAICVTVGEVVIHRVVAIVIIATTD
jgi:hypothetical protein